MNHPRPEGETNEEYRQAFAAHTRAELAEARRALPPGATAYAVVTTTDRTGLTPPVRRFVGRYPGKIGWHPAAPCPNETRAGDMPPGPWRSPMDAFGFTVCRRYPDGHLEGENYRARRYEVHHTYLEEFKPQPRDVRDRARRAREARSVEADAADSPLFGDQIRAEGIDARRRPR